MNDTLEKIKGRIYMALLQQKATSKGSAIPVSDLGSGIRDAISMLLRDKRICITKGKSPRVYLTPKGEIVAMGELSVQLESRKR